MIDGLESSAVAGLKQKSCLGEDWPRRGQEEWERPALHYRVLLVELVFCQHSFCISNLSSESYKLGPLLFSVEFKPLP